MDEHVGDTDASQSGSGDQSFTDPSGEGETNPPTDTSQSEGTPDPAADVTQGDETGQVPPSESNAPPNPTGSAPPPEGAGAEPIVEQHPPEPEDPMVSAEPPAGTTAGLSDASHPAGAVQPDPVTGLPRQHGETDSATAAQAGTAGAPGEQPVEAEGDGSVSEPDQIATERPDLGTE